MKRKMKKVLDTEGMINKTYEIYAEDKDVEGMPFAINMKNSTLIARGRAASVTIIHSLIKDLNEIHKRTPYAHEDKEYLHDTNIFFEDCFVWQAEESGYKRLAKKIRKLWQKLR